MEAMRPPHERLVGPLGAFVSSELEAAYRAAERTSDLRSARVVAVVALVLSLAFALVDISIQHDAKLLAVLLVGRLVNALVAVLIVARLPKLEAPESRDRLMVLWAVVFAITSIALVLGRPTSFGVPLGSGLLLVLAFMNVLQASFKAQLTAVCCMLMGFVAARVSYPTAAFAVFVSSLGIFGAGVSLSSFASLHMHRNKRALFFALHEQRTLRAERETALAEIRTLRGIVPICSFCHKIRDEAGAWQRVETYVSERTHAEFSHAFCPTCVDTHYPDDGPQP